MADGESRNEKRRRWRARWKKFQSDSKERMKQQEGSMFELHPPSILRTAIYQVFHGQKCFGMPIQQSLPSLCTALLVPQECFLVQPAGSQPLQCVIWPHKSAGFFAKGPASASASNEQQGLPAHTPIFETCFPSATPKKTSPYPPGDTLQADQSHLQTGIGAALLSGDGTHSRNC